MTQSSGFCLETLLEAAKFVEDQEQQQLKQQQNQVFVVASGISHSKIPDVKAEFSIKEEIPIVFNGVKSFPPAQCIKSEELPPTEHKPSPCYTNNLNGGSTTSSVITPLSPAPALYPAHPPHSQPTTTIINTTHLTTNHITITNGLLQHRPLVKEEMILTNVDSSASITTQPALYHQVAFPLHCDEEMDQDDARMSHHTSSSSSSLAGSVVSTSPNSLQSSSELIKKRTGISGIREVHNKLEKNRRAHLKECFEILKRQVPPAQEEKKSSNLSILHSAIRYIQFLRRREREFEHEMERLAREKIHAQQRLALLKKELSARWEHIDFNTLIPDNMEVDIPYDNQPRASPHLSFNKDRSFLDEEGGLVIVANGRAANEDVRSRGSSCEQGERGESWRGEFVRGGEEWRGEMMYSSSSSLSSTMSPLHNHSTSQTHIQVVTSSPVTSSSLPLHLLSSSNVRLLPVPSSSDNTIHTPHHKGGLKSSPPHHLSPTSISLSPPHSSPTSTVIVADSKYGPAELARKYPSDKGPDVKLIVDNGVKYGAGVIHSTPGPTHVMNGKPMYGATLVKSQDSLALNGAPKLVSLSSLPPGLIASPHNTQVLFTQHHKILPSTAATTPLQLKSIPSLPALQPISSPSTPQHIILKPSGALPARLVVPSGPRIHS